ncbi:hypothetical protein J3D57_001026 [Bacillus amyloliquefaciens]|nr:hypothetical protein [Bacillus amyloliquefaciens]
MKDKNNTAWNFNHLESVLGSALLILEVAYVS